jgi:hypothetical protein
MTSSAGNNVKPNRQVKPSITIAATRKIADLTKSNKDMLCNPDDEILVVFPILHQLFLLVSGIL